jgi:hypothetical protein
MSLSDREKRLLSLIESGLRADDPKFASRVRRGVRSRRRRLGGALFVVGLLMLVTGVAVRATMVDNFPILSVLGFTVMFGGAIVAVAGAHATSDRADTSRGPGH